MFDDDTRDFMIVLENEVFIIQRKENKIVVHHVNSSRDYKLSDLLQEHQDKIKEAMDKNKF